MTPVETHRRAVELLAELDVQREKLKAAIAAYEDAMDGDAR